MKKLKEKFPIGTQVGNRTIIGVGKWSNEVLCECGCADRTISSVRLSNLNDGTAFCCGCLEYFISVFKENYLEHCPVGEPYGDWTVLGEGTREMTWACRHKSGKVLDIFAPLLLSGRKVELDGRQETVHAGQRFVHIIAVREAARDRKGRLQWYCEDDRAENTVMTSSGSSIIRPSELLSGKKKGIGKRQKDLTGLQFGFLTPVKPAPPKDGISYWYCLCRCGLPGCRSLNPETQLADILIRVRTDYLTSGATKSCNCSGRRVHTSSAQGAK